MPSQIPLSFPVSESYAREDFMPSDCNAEALAWIDRWPDWPYPALVIYGPAGAGKTHLAALWAERAPEHQVIDDAHHIFGRPDAEKELFHRFNIARESAGSLLLTMDKPVAQQDILLPDLASRLRAAPQAEIAAPDDTALQAVLVKLFHDRQMKVEPEVIAYILPRVERSFAAARSLVREIDENSLSEKRSVTIPLVRGLLPYNTNLL